MATRPRSTSDSHEFLLEVPLDASKVSDFKPDRPVKVVVVSKQGETQDQLVNLNESGKGTASFRFAEAPGSLQVLMGPETASAADLQNLQTISVAVPASSWRAAREVKLPDVAISSYYWWWWWHWCRNFKISGRVLCANGSPVVGATVCAIDVDYWWWWSSQEQVGCATTDATGSFEIDFTRCCGWWPLWWWETRDWLVDPILVDQITTFVKQSGRVGQLPRAIPTPSLDVFQPLLASARKAIRADISTNTSRAIAGVMDPTVEPAALASLRDRLVEVLPKGFPFPIWPWYPWFPWNNCDANIIFKVTQVCGGAANTIVNETVSETRWDIPTTLNVTLTASEEACCAFSCGDDCPDGVCIVPNEICATINVGSIGGNLGAPAVISPSQIGLYLPGVQDRPFAGVVSIYGYIPDTVDVDYYEFQYSTSQAGPYSPLPQAALLTITRQVLVPAPPPFLFKWVPVAFLVNKLSDGTTNHYVYETIHHYEAINGTQTWDSSHDWLLSLNSPVLTNGTYYLRLMGFVGPDTSGNLAVMNADNPGNPGILPICDPQPDGPLVNNWWVITLDNRAPGDTDPSGQPAGLHIQTDQPLSAILQVAILRGKETIVIGGCEQLCIEPGDLLQIDFAAYDPDGFLQGYDLQLLYGVDQSVDLLCSAPFPTCSPAFTTWSLTPSPIAPSWAPGAAQFGPAYADALTQGATSPVWSGGSMRLTVNASSAFQVTCAYLLQLTVSKRPIVDCDANDYLQNNVSFESFTIQVGCAPPAAQ
jgi:hypothetical protein